MAGLPTQEVVRILMMCWDLIPKFCNRIGLCFGVGPGSQAIINRTSIDEERVEIFIQKSFYSRFISGDSLGSINEKYSLAFLRFIMVVAFSLCFLCITFIFVYFF